MEDRNFKKEILNQFFCTRVEPTVLSSPVDSMKNPSRLANDQTANHEILSSKNEGALGDLPAGYTSPAADVNWREKRLFFHLVTTSTLLNYAFISTTITKTVHLLNSLFLGGQLICRPEGYAVCPYTSQTFG